MFVLRPVELSDVDACMQLATLSSIGMTSLPKNRNLLEKKILHALDSYRKQVDTPKNELYLFILQDRSTKEIIGISGIEAVSGNDFPALYFKLQTEYFNRQDPHFPKKMSLLIPHAFRHGPSEMCSLYLHHKWRKGGLGYLLSMSRFLFMADRLERFNEKTMAVMRAYIEEDNDCPFWDSIGRHFYHADYKTFIEDFHKDRTRFLHAIPKYPIYVDLLPEEAQKAIGITHSRTKPALKMLVDQGFQFSGFVDLFDGGPKIIAETASIKTISESKTCLISEIVKTSSAKDMALIATCGDNFRCVFTPIHVTEKGAVITAEAADALSVEIGETIRYKVRHA